MPRTAGYYTHIHMYVYVYGDSFFPHQHELQINIFYNNLTN